MAVFQPVLDAVVQAAGTALPEFDQAGRDDVATPVRGAGNVQRVPGADQGGTGHQVGLAGEDLALVAGPGADAAGVGAGIEVGVGFGFGQLVDAAFDTHLALQFGPEEGEGDVGVQGDGTALAALIVGEEDEALVVDFLQQHDAGVGVAVFVDGGDVHGGGFMDLGMHGGIQPGAELFQRLAGAVGLGQFLPTVVLADVVQIQFAHGRSP